ncbi:MAG: hypothetical protein WA040_16815 [Anaerolineae bacterium]
MPNAWRSGFRQPVRLAAPRPGGQPNYANGFHLTLHEHALAGVVGY